MIEKTNVYVVGSGGREAMLARLLRESAHVDKLYIGPGNGGTPECGENTSTVPDYPRCRTFLDFLKAKNVGLVVSGSETDLVRNLGDVVRMNNILFVGASGSASIFEGSKIFAREFMAANEINHPEYMVFDGSDASKNQADARAYAQEKFGTINGLVIKADGLAGGKGVTVAHNLSEFDVGLANLLKYGDAGKKFLVEHMLEGVEVSTTVLVSSARACHILPFAQDYKRAEDGDKGENTGGMGAVTVDLPNKICQEIRSIITKTLLGAEHIGRPIEGAVLYVGLMITPEGKPYVLEYNMRLGDPETQVILPGITSDMREVLHTLAEKRDFWPNEVKHDGNHYATVVLAGKGYPGDYKSSEGKQITGLEEAAGMPNVIINIAGTTRTADGLYIVKGSRNINVIGSGTTQEEALRHAYAAVEKIQSDGLFYRKDIGCNLDKIRKLG